jgi:hypothetical protein
MLSFLERPGQVSIQLYHQLLATPFIAGEIVSKSWSEQSRSIVIGKEW